VLRVAAVIAVVTVRVVTVVTVVRALGRLSVPVCCGIRLLVGGPRVMCVSQGVLRSVGVCTIYPGGVSCKTAVR